MEEQKKYLYSVEMYRNVGTEKSPYYEWVTDFREYHGMKNLDDEDLKDIPNKRRNAQFKGAFNKRLV